ncbi:MAG: hypothetical protein J5545_02135 [Bacteroidaceae bacterium]|nr:hypothetical protein [Bacteroidaceae bacterium]
MKKNYIQPELKPFGYEVEGMICALSSIGGDAGISFADDDDDVPGTADAPENPFGGSFFE